MKLAETSLYANGIRTLIGVASFCVSINSWSASHREAPRIAMDPTADITDVYAFRSWEDPTKVVFILNVIPGQEPGSGPNYFNFDDTVAYDLHLDLNQDGRADDIVYRIRFKTDFRGVSKQLKLPVPNAAVPPVTSLSGSGSEGLGLRQRYSVTEFRGSQSRDLSQGQMFAVPSNMGPATMPDYESLANQGIYPLANGGRVFAGQRDETFYIDLGATFDSVNLRRTPPVLTAGEDANDGVNPFGNDTFSGFNVNTIALEIPISRIVPNFKQGSNPVIGVYASTSRATITARTADGKIQSAGGEVQVSRMANPLVNELIIGTGQKDRWNSTDPADEAQFKGFYLNPRLAKVLNIVFDLPSKNLEIPSSKRTDLLNTLLKYPSQDQTGTCDTTSTCSELLRLNLGVEPRAPAQQKRLTALAGDPAGWPNGRRPNDDVTDVALRVVAGVLQSPTPASGKLALGDGVNFNIGAPGTNISVTGIASRFPFLPTPHDGRNRRHIDCDEPTGNPCN